MLTVVPTPIGHMDDITLRALACLREADTILAEDTRHTRKLCRHHGISTPLQALHAHSSAESVARYVEQLEAGKRLALVSDAGTPLISDPGSALVQAARQAGVAVIALPGASAVTTALCVAGVPFASFRFVGFIPRTGSKRARAVADIVDAQEASVMFESPRRLAATLRDLQQALGEDRKLAVCRELTKLHEEVVSGTPAEVAERFSDGALGEITLVIEGHQGPKSDEVPQAAELDEQIQTQLATGDSARDVARTLAQKWGLPRREVYNRVLALHRREDDDAGQDDDGNQDNLRSEG